MNIEKLIPVSYKSWNTEVDEKQIYFNILQQRLCKIVKWQLYIIILTMYEYVYTMRLTVHTVLLMEDILHKLMGSLSHHLQGFIHPRSQMVVWYFFRE